MIFYSESASGFYLAGSSVVVPADAKEIPESEYRRLLEGQEQGLRIIPDAQGLPTLADPLPLPPDMLEATERAWRNAALDQTDALVARHRDELEDGSTTLTPAQYTELQAYRRALRNWPEAGEFPLIDHRPLPPPWLTELFH